MSSSSAATRLALLEGYLEEDSGNEALRAAAFDAAHEAGRTDSAAVLAQDALARGHPASTWLHRLAQVRLAQGDASAARALLLQAQQAGALAAIVDHDLAWLAYAQGDAQRCLDLLRPHVDEGESMDPGVLGPLQALWLRALHRLGQFDAAAGWTAVQEAAERLQPPACGVASLLAWDAGRLDTAERLAHAALKASPGNLEGRLTVASLALMRRQNAMAEHHVLAALEGPGPGEGRSWFVAGLASLQRGDVPQAQERFSRATDLMPAHIGSWHGLGWARLLAGDLAAALGAFDSALALDPAFGESQGAVGLVHALRADVARAEPCLRTALKLDPAGVTARYARAVLAGEAGTDRLQALAACLLDRPGFFGASLAVDALGSAPDGPVNPAPT